MTRLVTVAHGTRHAPGNEVARRLTVAAASALRMPAIVSYVELCAPTLDEVMLDNDEPALVVPLLLSTGFHLRHDLPAAVRTSAAPVEIAPALGPDPLLAAAQCARLLDAGADPGSRVVMVAAGSRDPAAAPDLAAARSLLELAWGGEVVLAAMAGPAPRPEEVVRPGDAVSPYLLAGGFFADKATAQARSAGAAVVADVIGPHERVVELVVRRALGLMDAALAPAA
ncbi:sirohydrochlorin chelatase [Nocardioides pacificus]